MKAGIAFAGRLSGMAADMAARQCAGITAAGQPCRRPPSRDSDYCLAHATDSESREAHIDASRAGGIARHDPNVLDGKASIREELREIKAALWSRSITPGIATALLQTIRLESEQDRPDSADGFIESIHILRASGVPDLSETANDDTGGVSSYPVNTEDTPEWRAHVAEMEDKDAERERIRTAPLDELTLAERRQRLTGNRR